MYYFYLISFIKIIKEKEARQKLSIQLFFNLTLINIKNILFKKKKKLLAF
jgi:hypothetical protein